MQRINLKLYFDVWVVLTTSPQKVISSKDNRGREHDMLKAFSSPEHVGITSQPSVLHAGKQSPIL